MSEKFTKGPWVYESSRCRVSANYTDTVCSLGDNWVTYVNAEANAALIAAAPEMYDLLEKISIAMECFHGVDTDEINKLLAKARGEL